MKRELEFKARFDQEGQKRWEYLELTQMLDPILRSILEQETEWLQFTGRRDVLDKKIYDRDLVDILTPNAPPQLYVVIWDETVCGFLLQSTDNLLSRMVFPPALLCNEIMLIGSAYDNPTLIENEVLRRAVLDKYEDS
jgi:hypothetical protein